MINNQPERTMNKESQTQGTDAKFKNLSDLKTTDFVRFLKMTNFARRLEIAENHSQAMQKKLAYQLNEMTNQRNDLIFKLIAVTKQRDRLAEAVNAATILIAAKGRHNTMLAYEGLRDALQSLTTMTDNQHETTTL